MSKVIANSPSMTAWGWAVMDDESLVVSDCGVIETGLSISDKFKDMVRTNEYLIKKLSDIADDHNPKKIICSDVPVEVMGEFTETSVYSAGIIKWMSKKTGASVHKVKYEIPEKGIYWHESGRATIEEVIREHFIFKTGLEVKRNRWPVIKALCFFINHKKSLEEKKGEGEC